MAKRRRWNRSIRKRSDQLIDNPLFQLNLLVWLCYELPEHPNITPWLYHQGWEIHSIGIRLPVPATLRDDLSKLGVEHSYVRPDVLLNKGRRYIPTECKASSFGPDSTTAHQAAVLLALNDRHLVNALALPAGTRIENLLLYAVPSKAQDAMCSTLRKLAGELKRVGNVPSDADVLGITRTKKAIGLRFGARLAKFIGLHQRPKKDIEVIRILPGQDPRPLYVIPCDPSIGGEATEEYAIQSLRRRIHRALVHAVFRAEVGEEVSPHPPDLLCDATMGLSEKWEDTDAKKNLHRQIRAWLNQVLKKPAKGYPTAITERAGRPVLLIQNEDIRTLFAEACEQAQSDLWNKVGLQEGDLFGEP